MKEYVFVPIILASLLGVLADLEQLSLETSEKTVAFAQDAVDALDCAYEARPLTECSPTITGHDFSEQIAQTHDILEDVKAAQTSRTYEITEG